MSWRESVNQAVGPAGIADITQYLSYSAWPTQSPIDRFYAASRDLLAAGVPAVLTPHPVVGPLLIVGLISATENYFRDLLSLLINLCPISRAAAAEQPIKMGSVIWHAGIRVERGAFEHFSFADSDSIRKACRNFLGVNLKQGGPTEGILQEFDRVCELRHGIVHSGALLAGKNAIKLQLPQSTQSVEIRSGFAQLQESALVCTTLVATFNQELFIIFAGRWATEWRKSAWWNPKIQRRLFNEIWQTFFSQVDYANTAIADVMTCLQCRRLVRKEFNLI